MWPFCEYNEGEKAYEADQRHRRCEYKQWRKQNGIGQTGNVLTFLGVVAAVAAAYWAENAYIEAHNQATSAAGQLEEAKKQTLITRNAYRSWLDVSLVPPNVEVKWSGKDGPTVKSYYSITNSVSAPAIYANEYVVPKVSAIGQQNELNWAKDACAQDYGPGMGTIITQRTPLNGWSATTLLQADIDRWRQTFSQQSHVKVESVRFFSLTLIVCAIYKTVGDDLWHHTARMYQAGELGADGKTTLFISLDHDLVIGKSWAAEQTQGGYID